MMERGVRGAAAFRALGCGVVVVMLLLTVVAEGQARVGHPPGRASVGKGALAPVTFTYTGGEQTYTVPAGVSSLQVQAVGANGGDATQSELPEGRSRGDRWDGDRRAFSRLRGRRSRLATRCMSRSVALPQGATADSTAAATGRRRRWRRRRRERCAGLLADVAVLCERGYEPAGASDCRRRWRRRRRLRFERGCMRSAGRAAPRADPAAPEGRRGRHDPGRRRGHARGSRRGRRRAQRCLPQR